jgi:malate permease and related proteins
MLAARIVQIVLPIFGIVAVGAAYGRYRRPAMEVANRINLDVFVPALVFSALSKQSFDVTLLQVAVGGAAVILGSGLAAWWLSVCASVQPKTFVPPMMFRNAGNMGLPLLVLAFGDAGLPAALILFLLGNLAHFGLGTYILDQHARMLDVFKQPVIIAAIVALLVSITGITMPKAIALPINMLGQIAVPLMLFALGVRLTDSDFGEWRIGLLGAVFAPVIGILLASAVLPLLALPKPQAGVLFLFGALPPAVLNFLFAERYNQEPAKVASIVMLSNLATIVTLPLALAFALPRYG